MASRNASSAPESPPERKGPGAVGWAALALAAYAAVVGTLAFVRGGGGGGGSGGTGPSGDGLDARLAAHERSVRDGVQGDIRAAAAKGEEVATRFERKIDELRTDLAKRSDDARRLAEGAVRAGTDHHEALDGRIREVAQTADRT